jgi:hypothetical protein
MYTLGHCVLYQEYRVGDLNPFTSTIDNTGMDSILGIVCSVYYTGRGFVAHYKQGLYSLKWTAKGVVVTMDNTAHNTVEGARRKEDKVGQHALQCGTTITCRWGEGGLEWDFGWGIAFLDAQNKEKRSRPLS